VHFLQLQAGSGEPHGLVQLPLRNLAPRFGVPGLLSFWGAFVDLLQILYDNFADTIDLGAAQASGNLLSPLVLR
jgi:hypothetical protein